MYIYILNCLYLSVSEEKENRNKTLSLYSLQLYLRKEKKGKYKFSLLSHIIFLFISIIKILICTRYYGIIIGLSHSRVLRSNISWSFWWRFQVLHDKDRIHLKTVLRTQSEYCLFWLIDLTIWIVLRIYPNNQSI